MKFGQRIRSEEAACLVNHRIDIADQFINYKVNPCFNFLQEFRLSFDLHGPRHSSGKYEKFATALRATKKNKITQPSTHWKKNSDRL
jgi:hypothetical protein